MLLMVELTVQLMKKLLIWWLLSGGNTVLSICGKHSERNAKMPKFGIFVTKDDKFLFWYYTLVIDHKPVPNGVAYANPQAAFQAALFEANRRGYYNV